MNRGCRHLDLGRADQAPCDVRADDRRTEQAAAALAAMTRPGRGCFRAAGKSFCGAVANLGWMQAQRRDGWADQPRPRRESLPPCWAALNNAAKPFDGARAGQALAAVLAWRPVCVWRSGWIRSRWALPRRGLGIIPSDHRPLRYWREWAKGGAGGVQCGPSV